MKYSNTIMIEKSEPKIFAIITNLSFFCRPYATQHMDCKARSKNIRMEIPETLCVRQVCMICAGKPRNIYVRHTTIVSVPSLFCLMKLSIFYFPSTGCLSFKYCLNLRIKNLWNRRVFSGSASNGKNLHHPLVKVYL